MRSVLACAITLSIIGCGGGANDLAGGHAPSATGHMLSDGNGDGGSANSDGGSASSDGGGGSSDGSPPVGDGGSAAPAPDLGPLGCGAHGQPTIAAQHQSGLATLQLTNAMAYWSLPIASPPSGDDALLIWGMDLATGQVALRHGVSGGSEIPQVPLAAFQTRGSDLYLQGPGGVEVVSDSGSSTLHRYQNGMSGTTLNPGGASWIDDQAAYFIAPNWNGQYNPVFAAPYALGPTVQLEYVYSGSIAQPGPEHLGALLTDEHNLYFVSREYDSLPPNDVQRGNTDLMRLGLDGSGTQQLLHTFESIGYAFIKQDAANVYVVQDYADFSTIIAVDKTGAGAKLIYQAPHYLEIEEFEIDDRFVAWVEAGTPDQYTLKIQNRCSGVIETLETGDSTSIPRNLALGKDHLFWVDGTLSDATVWYVPLS